MADQVPDGRKNRYHLSEDAVIELQSGEVIAISNQWGLGNIQRVIDFLRRDGFIIEKVEQ
ncbi:TPA: hypothetical protein MAZ15_004559 [Klebsiella aerogenes]|nr:hypothetical protein [Klebsiella aerogenes]